MLVRSLRLVGPLLGGLLAVACTNVSPAEDVSAASDEIIDGERADSPGLDAVVALVKIKSLPDGTTVQKAFCTGSLIAPDLVLTAKHCVATEGLEPSGFLVAFGVEAATSRKTVGVASYVPAKLADLAEDVMTAGQDALVIRLAEPVTDVTPLPVGALRRSDVGKPVTVVGYGFSDGPSTKRGVRLKGKSKVVALHASYETEVGERRVDARICQGDSGGPLLMERDGKLVVTGILSQGAIEIRDGHAECGNPATYVRLTHRACSNGGRAGETTCDGAVWKRCDPGAATAESETGSANDCGALNPPRRCDPTARGYACKSL